MSETNAPGAQIEVRMAINGQVVGLELEPWVSLLDALRERLDLSGTKKGCDQGACGACTVLVDGERICSCLALAVQYDGREITTIEGVAETDRPHPLQLAFIRHDGFQCGYCTSGQICSAIGMLAEYAAGAPIAVTEQSRRTCGMAPPSPQSSKSEMAITRIWLVRAS